MPTIPNNMMHDNGSISVLEDVRFPDTSAIFFPG